MRHVQDKSSCPARCMWDATKSVLTKPKPTRGLPAPALRQGHTSSDPRGLSDQWPGADKQLQPGVVEFNPSQACIRPTREFFKAVVRMQSPANAVSAFKGDMGSDPGGVASTEAADIEYHGARRGSARSSALRKVVCVGFAVGYGIAA